MHRIVERLDRPGTRSLLALMLRLRIRQLYGERVSVAYDDDAGVWMVRWRDVVVPMREVVPTAPRDYEVAHEDVFFQEYRPGSGDTIVDLGAGVGSEVDLMSRLVGPSGRVIAIEADPLTFTCLRLRVELNAIENVTPLQYAVLDEPGTVRISSDGHHLGHHVLPNGHGAGESVPATTVDQLVRDHELERIDLLKVNIEGSEARAFAGMRESIARVRSVAVSCHDFIGHDTRTAVEAMLRDNGFSIRERRRDDTRAWARSWIYGVREGSQAA